MILHRLDLKNGMLLATDCLEGAMAMFPSVSLEAHLLSLGSLKIREPPVYRDTFDCRRYRVTSRVPIDRHYTEIGQAV